MENAPMRTAANGEQKFVHLGPSRAAGKPSERVGGGADHGAFDHWLFRLRVLSLPWQTLGLEIGTR